MRLYRQIQADLHVATPYQSPLVPFVAHRDREAGWK